jgi:hypothetical protein
MAGNTKAGKIMSDRKIEMQWLTTAPNPRSPATGFDAGQRGWRTHAVECKIGSNFGDVRFVSAACGLRPAHGWGLDTFIEDKCQRCAAKLRLNRPIPYTQLRGAEP